jgi:hypothetical protein
MNFSKKTTTLHVVNSKKNSATKNMFFIKTAILIWIFDKCVKQNPVLNVDNSSTST